MGLLKKEKMKILIQKGKYGDDIYNISTENLKHGAAIDIIKNNLENHNYPDHLLEELEQIVIKRDGKAAWTFINSRANYEYERLEIEELKAIEL